MNRNVEVPISFFKLQLYKSKCGRPMSVSCLPELITWFEMLLSDVVGIRRLSLASVVE